MEGGAASLGARTIALPKEVFQLGVVLEERNLGVQRMSRIFTLQNEGKIWLGRKYTTYDGLILRCLNEYNVGVRNVCFAKSGSYFCSVDEHGKIIVFDIRRNNYQTIPKVRVLPSPSGISFSPLREMEVVFPLKSFQCCVIDLTNAKIFKYLDGSHQNPIISISYSLNGKRCITSSSERVVVWNSKNFDKLKTLVFPEPVVQSVYTKNFLIVMTTKTIHIVNSLNYEIIHKMEAPEIFPPEYCLTFFDISKNEELLIAGGKGLPVCILWDFKGNRVMKLIAFPEMEKRVKKVKFHPLTETKLFVLTERGKIYEIAIPSLEILSSFTNICTWIDDFDLSVHEEEDTDEDLISSTGRRNHLYKHTNNNYILCALRNGGIHMYDLETVRKHNDKLRSFESGSNDVQFLREWTPGFYERFEENTEIDLRSKPRQSTASSSTLSIKKKKTRTSDTTSHPVYLQTDEGDVIFQYEKIKDMLLRKGKYDAQYRKLIWQYLLSLPSNQMKYKSLLGMGNAYRTSITSTLRPFFTKREETATIYRRLEKLMTILSNVGPVFALTETTAEVCYPLLQVFHHDVFFCLEFVLTFFQNWGKRWFEFYPNPPVSVLNMVEHLLQVYDSELLKHFKVNRITPKLYCWEIMKNLFTEIFNPKDWLCVMDYILTFSRSGSTEISSSYTQSKITGTPMFLYYFVIGFLKYHRDTLLQTRSVEGFETFFRSIHGSKKRSLRFDSSGSYVREIFEIVLSFPSEPGLEYMDYRGFQALPKGEYPLFNLYPKYQVNYQLNRRQRILEEERRIYQREGKRVEIARKEKDAKERLFKKKVEEENRRRKNLRHFNYKPNFDDDSRGRNGGQSGGKKNNNMKSSFLKTPVPRSRVPQKSHVSMGSTVQFRPSQDVHPIGRKSGGGGGGGKFVGSGGTSSSSSSSVMTNPKVASDTISLPAFPVLGENNIDFHPGMVAKKDVLTGEKTNTFQRMKKSEEEDNVERKMEDAEEKLRKLQNLHSKHVFERRRQNHIDERFRKQDEAIRHLKTMSRKKDEKVEKLEKQLGILKKHKKMEKLWETNKGGRQQHAAAAAESSPPLNRSENYHTSRILSGERPPSSGDVRRKVDESLRRKRMMRVGGRKTVAEKIRARRMRENERKRKRLQNRLFKLEKKVSSQRSLLQRLEFERKRGKVEERRRLKEKLKRMKLKKRLEQNKLKRDELKKKRKKMRIQKERRDIDNNNNGRFSMTTNNNNSSSRRIRRRIRRTINGDHVVFNSSDDSIPTPERTTSESDGSQEVVTTSSSSSSTTSTPPIKQQQQVPSSIAQRISDIRKPDSHSSTREIKSFRTPSRTITESQLRQHRSPSSSSSSPQQQQQQQSKSLQTPEILQQKSQGEELNLSKERIKKKFEEFIEKRKRKLHEQTSQIPELSWMEGLGSSPSGSSTSFSVDDDGVLKNVDDSLSSSHSEDEDEAAVSPLDTPTSSANTSIISTGDLSLSELSEDTMKLAEDVILDDGDDDEGRNSDEISKIMNGKYITIPIDSV